MENGKERQKKESKTLSVGYYSQAQKTTNSTLVIDWLSTWNDGSKGCNCMPILLIPMKIPDYQYKTPSPIKMKIIMNS